MRTLAASVLVALTVAPAAGSEAAVETLRFAWPPSSAATVALTSERAVGSTSLSVTLRMRLEVEPDGSDGRLLIRLGDPEVRAINGVPFARARRDTEAFDVARAMRVLTPSFVVSGAGEYLEDREVDRLVRNVLAAAGFPDIPLAMDAFRDLVTGIAPSDWQAWVELWIGQRPQPGDWMRTDRIVAFEGMLTPVTVGRKALEPSGPGRSRLEASAQFPSEAVRHYTTGFLLDLAIAAEELGEDVLANRKFVEKARFSPVTETVTAELETGTLRPLLVERTRSFFATAGSHRVEGRERRVHRFVWDEPTPVPDER